MMTDEQMGKLANGQRAVAPAAGSFRTQLHWQKAQAFAVQSALLVGRLPHDRSADSIGNQLIRAAGSIAANIAEGYERFSQAAYRNHLSIARGSAFEAESWLDLLIRCEFVADALRRRLLEDCIEVQKLLSYRMKNLPQGKTYISEEPARYEV
jgi:four helix bundle protein